MGRGGEGEGEGEGKGKDGGWVMGMGYAERGRRTILKVLSRVLYSLLCPKKCYLENKPRSRRLCMCWGRGGISSSSSSGSSSSVPR